MATPAATTAPTTPANGGGVIGNVAWTGGPPFLNKLTVPRSPMCYRPTDFRGATKVHEGATQGLLVKIDVTKENKVTQVAFLNNLTAYLKKHGLDSVFWLFCGTATARTQSYIIRDYARYDYEQVRVEVDDLLANGNAYDHTNLEWSGEAILNSVGPTLLGDLQKFLTEEIYGPLVFMRVMGILQSCTTSALRTVEIQLRDMKLRKEPAENVDTYCNKVQEKCRLLEGADRLPIDAPSMIANGLSTSTVENFRVLFIGIFNALETNPVLYTYLALIQRATSAYRAAKDRNEWGPLLLVKASEPSVQMNQARLIQRGGTNDVRDCWNCGGRGHFANQCPSPRLGGSGRQNVNANSDTGNNSSNAGSEPTISWKKIPPSDGTRDMTRNGKSYKWCGTCNRWNTSHYTNGHTGGRGNGGGRGRGGRGNRQRGSGGNSNSGGATQGSNPQSALNQSSSNSESQNENDANGNGSTSSNQARLNFAHGFAAASSLGNFRGV